MFFFKALNWKIRTIFKGKLNISRGKFRIFGGKINNWDKKGTLRTYSQIPGSSFREAELFKFFYHRI